MKNHRMPACTMMSRLSPVRIAIGVLGVGLAGYFIFLASSFYGPIEWRNLDPINKTLSQQASGFVGMDLGGSSGRITSESRRCGYSRPGVKEVPKRVLGWNPDQGQGASVVLQLKNLLMSAGYIQDVQRAEPPPVGVPKSAWKSIRLRRTIRGEVIVAQIDYNSEFQRFTGGLDAEVVVMFYALC